LPLFSFAFSRLSPFHIFAIDFIFASYAFFIFTLIFSLLLLSRRFSAPPLLFHCHFRCSHFLRHFFIFAGHDAMIRRAACLVRGAGVRIAGSV